MTFGHAILFIADCGLPTGFAWMAWRMARTGEMFGSTEIRWGPNRQEKPVRFWLIVALYVALSLGSAYNIFDRYGT